MNFFSPELVLKKEKKNFHGNDKKAINQLALSNEICINIFLSTENWNFFRGLSGVALDGELESCLMRESWVFLMNLEALKLNSTLKLCCAYSVIFPYKSKLLQWKLRFTKGSVFKRMHANRTIQFSPCVNALFSQFK